MAHHSETLVVDFDDTIAITLNRNWTHATPNQPLIDKLNSFYSEGWDIHILTARGQLSCNGNSEQADTKYRQQIEDWLNAHGVQYTSLSFQKKLGAYYIDDKGITPEAFVSDFSRVKLPGGLSGASVYYDSITKSVFKSASNSKLAIEWYDHASKLGYNVPKIYSLIGDTIRMELLYQITFNSDKHFESLLDICYSFSKHKPLHAGILPYRYVDRCIHRLRSTGFGLTLDLTHIEKILEFGTQYTPISFSHGDFSISNIMTDSRGINYFMIDPINDPTLLSSWIIDIAKLYMSILYKYGPAHWYLIQIEIFMKSKGISKDIVLSHVLGHLCRVYPYLKEADMINKYESLIKEIINVFR